MLIKTRNSEFLNQVHTVVRWRQLGVSMVELILFIVIIGIALAGILLVMNTVTGRSADTLVRKQALAIGESLLEEIQLQDVISTAGATSAVMWRWRIAQMNITSCVITMLLR